MKLKKHFIFTLLFILFITLLTACSISLKYTINYVVNVDENKIITKSYASGTTLSLIDMNNDSIYQLTNYKRDGWYYDDDFNEKVNYPFEVKENKTIYLKWEKLPDLSYKIKFYSNGSLYDEQDIIKGDLVTKPNDPEKENSIFLGWFDSSYENEFDFDTKINEDYDLFAKWEDVNTYKVNFYSNGLLYDEQEVLKGLTINKPTDPTNGDYEFLGWFDSSYEDEFDFDTIIDSNLNLFAKWNNNSYTINFLVDDNIYNSYQIINEGKINKPTDPTKDGYEFLGWFDSLENEFDFDTIVNSNLNLFAKWQKIINKYTVNYYDGANIIKTTELDENSTIENYNYEKDGYEFLGWYTDSALTKEFDFDTTLTKNISLYAKLKIKTYRVTYYVDNNEYYTETVNYNNYADGPTSNPLKDGYVFTGWYKDIDLANKFNLSTNKIKETINLYAGFEEFNNIEITSYSGYNEGIYVILPNNSVDLSNYTISYSLANENNYKEIDSNLIRIENSKIRADILGLTAGFYDVKIEISGVSDVIKNIAVYEHDRSGYAHFNYTTGVGAYNDDGSLKSNAAIVYVTNATKNTVTYGGQTGLINILTHSWTVPLNIRILDRIETTQFNKITYTSAPKTAELVDEQALSLGGNYKSYTASEIISNGWNSYSDDLANGITALNGLSSKVSYSTSDGEFDTAWNNCSISNVSNVTVEGIGENAGLFQWGFTFNKCNSIEVRNLTFTDYTEDACSFQSGGNSNVTLYGNFWVHNCTFNRGKNNWDLTKEQDKNYGDGATDFKYIHNVTSSYNVFNNCKKTGLVGGSDSNYTMNITFHHNFYNNVGSRLPLGRQANMHIYNNYYYNCSTCQDIRANAFVLSESNYFSGCTTCHKVTITDTYTATVIKSFNDYVSGGIDQATKVTSREQQLSGNCKPDGSTDYTNFDTNSSLFYYDSINKKSDVSIMNETNDLPTIVPCFAGAGENYYKSILVNQATEKVIITLMNGTEIFQTLKVNKNEAATKPTTYPSSLNGIFDTWVDENDDAFDWENIITENITLYAKFKTNPTYENLKTNSNAIIVEDFNSSTENQKLTQFTDISNKGIFGNSADYTNAYACYTGSSVKTVDNDANSASEIYISFGEEYTSGIVKGWVEINVGPNVGSKWALLTFYNKDLEALFKFGTNSDKYLSYALNDVSLENGTVLINSSITANNTYKIYYEFNLDEGTTTFIIDGTTYLNNEKTNIKSLAGFYTMTNKAGAESSARIITLDNIVVIKED